ncbi:MAG: biosynthetic arginine decarboxylase, partial [Planctomycetes bacterium]|nr:biosynthetic arginine decarboxylase [Planctomycetota bacterium]
MLLKTDIRWSARAAAEFYQTPHWGAGYFSVGENGNLLVHPTKDPAKSLDLKQLVDRLQLQGVDLPVLLRFSGILQNRIRELNDAFQRAIQEYGYRGRYCCVFPVKVNQQRHVVEEVMQFGREYGFGLEAGSKPELLAVAAAAYPETPIICNGFKDSEFIEMAMLARKMGRPIIPVVEKYTELAMILHHAERIGVRPAIGMRVKLASPGSGRWALSGGYRSKFGLTVSEILRGLEELRERGMEDCLKLLHFHLGSQITNIRHVKRALHEAGRIYVELAKRGAGMEYLDVGGGLGVDYDGSQTNFDSSMNYTLQEYANDVVHHIQQVCDDAELPHPTIISESGRALVSHHSVLVFSVLGVSSQSANGEPGDDEAPPEFSTGESNIRSLLNNGELEEAEAPLKDLLDTYRELKPSNLLESYHDAQQALEMLIHMFNAGRLSLELRAAAEDLFRAICRKIRTLTRELDRVPEELHAIDQMLADTYFCNFSLFQSIPDSWAINQLFPVMPVHRLHERPTRPAVLGDITCDSDGKIDHFISGVNESREYRPTINLHAYDGSPYYLGVFLVGAYQEILGDLHNLFGDTNAVHVTLSDDGEVILENVVKGDSVREVL